MIRGAAYPTAGATRLLMAAVARRTARRLGRVERALGAEARRVFAALAGTLSDLPADVRERALFGPDLRGFLGEAELWIDVARLAAPGSAGTAHPAGGSGRARRRVLERLFDRISRTEHLAALLPSGRVDARFPARCARCARRRLREALADLSSAVLGLRLAYPGGGPFDARLEFRAVPEQGRPADTIDLGTFAGPAGSLSIVAAGRRRPRSGGASPLHARIRFDSGTLTLGAPGRRRTIVPAAGSRLRAVDLPAAGRATAHAARSGPRSGSALLLARREMIPGTSILLAPAVHSSARRLRVGRPIPSLAGRLMRALRIVQLAWPDGHREILAHTFVVVPVQERGLVSYSLASRPGVSFINVFGKTLVDLADDLLHETAHHRLHSLQELETLLTPGPDTEEVQAFESPWRGTRRPLHGILHGGYTFLYRAELFHRLLRAARAHPRLFAPLLRPRGAAWVRRELRQELGMISGALRDLDNAGRSGLLSRAGKALIRSMHLWTRRLGRP